MLLCKIKTRAAYAAHLRGHPEEVQRLYQDALINVTSFFRDPKVAAGVLAERDGQVVLVKRAVDPRIAAVLKPLLGAEVPELRIAAAVTGELGGRGIFGVELFVKNDQVWFSEVSPRPHDTGMVTMTTQWQNEFELHARAILGLPVDVSLRAPGASAVIYGGVDAAGIAFEGVEQALAVPNSDLRLFGKPESFVRRRMGVALATGKDIDEARSRARSMSLCSRAARTSASPSRSPRNSARPSSPPSSARTLRPSPSPSTASPRPSRKSSSA